MSLIVLTDQGRSDVLFCARPYDARQYPASGERVNDYLVSC